LGVYASITKMPHGLVAGATGSGKSVCINTILMSFLFKYSPDELKLVLVDPKMVELSAYNDLPHLITPVITDAKIATAGLKWAVDEMENRFQMFSNEIVKDIVSYNEKVEREGKLKRMPYIVIVVDELADLMIVARENIETTIQRLAQLSRAVGIHLILATQRPSVDVITGVIKANFPARISFKVASRVDSRTVLDSMGADKLLGKGDLLFLKPGDIKLIRAQGSYIEDDDIDALTDFVRVQGRPIYEEGISKSEKKKTMHIEGDELFDEAVKTILRARQASGSMLQRRLRVGYTRAARLLDLMEQEGIVGPFCGSKAREILVEPEEFLAQKGIE
ncbi:MAG: DNA translocase FtsK, partial [Candidatus Omnitrophica bacterium]|nr:DNA translocase FtsK [Candidatus Omnitrophota bacterium]